MFNLPFNNLSHNFHICPIFSYISYKFLYKFLYGGGYARHSWTYLQGCQPTTRQKSARIQGFQPTTRQTSDRLLDNNPTAYLTKILPTKQKSYLLDNIYIYIYIYIIFYISFLYHFLYNPSLLSPNGGCYIYIYSLYIPY